VKRKMSSFPVKHREHRNWPRPTKTSAQAVVVVGAPEPAPITQQP
jgi:hypothetical protein